MPQLHTTISPGLWRALVDHAERTQEPLAHIVSKALKVFDTLVNSISKTVVCQHDPNAAFIAGGIGRMTGKAGVALVTSGPGGSDLVTGLATANAAGDPVVAIGGAVPIANRLKRIHQSMDTVSLFRPITNEDRSKKDM